MPVNLNTFKQIDELAAQMADTATKKLNKKVTFDTVLTDPDLYAEFFKRARYIRQVGAKTMEVWLNYHGYKTVVHAVKDEYAKKGT